MKRFLALLVSVFSLLSFDSDVQCQDVITNSIGIKLKSITSGTFIMGSDVSTSRNRNSQPAHRVTLTKPFMLGVYEVTQEQYARVMGNNPSHDVQPQNPVDTVSWEDAMEFCQKLSELPEEKAAGRSYRLPTEAEWEYACRAGTTTKYSHGEVKLDEPGPNPWGLHAMHGGVGEWCQDSRRKYQDVAVTDPISSLPTCPSPWHDRVVRHDQSSSRSWASMNSRSRYIGFRIASVTTEKTADLDESSFVMNSVGMRFRHVPKGTFIMGDDLEKKNRPSHQVHLTKPFSLGVYEVTQEQYVRVMGSNTSLFSGDQNPVDSVTWFDAKEFCRRLSELPEEKAMGRVYRLPTEAEWEYACRAGTKTAWSFGEDGWFLRYHAWYEQNSGGTTHSVGQKKPNAWGFYDMYGNVMEWCTDTPRKYQDVAETDPVGPKPRASERLSASRAVRGGGYRESCFACSSRKSHNPLSGAWAGSGFRVAVDGHIASNFDKAKYTARAETPAVNKADIEEIDVTTNSIGMKLKLIPPGIFTMGDKRGRDATLHNVILTKEFHIGVYEVTQEQYARVMGNNPSRFQNLQHPVETVSWDNAIEFCRRLSELPEEKALGRSYRLPTEAEWEYACRAGTKTRWSFGDDELQLKHHAWYHQNSLNTTHAVGEKQPNAWGLYDMHGNVAEFCQDWYGEYPVDWVTDPTGPALGSDRVIRGGQFGGAWWSYFRSKRPVPLPGAPTVGFRVTATSSKVAKPVQNVYAYDVKDGLPQGEFVTRWESGKVEFKEFEGDRYTLTRYTINGKTSTASLNGKLRRRHNGDVIIERDDGVNELMSLAQDALLIRQFGRFGKPKPIGSDWDYLGVATPVAPVAIGSNQAPMIAPDYSYEVTNGLPQGSFAARWQVGTMENKKIFEGDAYTLKREDWHGRLPGNKDITGKVSKLPGGDVILRRNDGFIERMTLTSDVIFIRHYRPKTGNADWLYLGIAVPLNK